MLLTHAVQILLKTPKNTALACRPLRIRHTFLCKTHKRVSRKSESLKLWGMAGDSPATQVQDLTSRKKALFDMYEGSKNAFPDVQAISCNELQDMLSSNEPIVLVDVRSPNEQSVSILPGHVVKKEDFARHPQDYSDSKIVTYCTIGVRSGKYAQELINQGKFVKVYNLKGSIVAWSQEGYPLVKGDGSQTPTTTVHTFGKAWDLVGDGYDSVMYGAVQGKIELVRSVLPPALGGR